MTKTKDGLQFIKHSPAVLDVVGYQYKRWGRNEKYADAAAVFVGLNYSKPPAGFPYMITASNARMPLLSFALPQKLMVKPLSDRIKTASLPSFDRQIYFIPRPQVHCVSVCRLTAAFPTFIINSKIRAISSGLRAGSRRIVKALCAFRCLQGGGQPPKRYVGVPAVAFISSVSYQSATDPGASRENSVCPAADGNQPRKRL